MNEYIGTFYVSGRISRVSLMIYRTCGIEEAIGDVADLLGEKRTLTGRTPQGQHVGVVCANVTHFEITKAQG